MSVPDDYSSVAAIDPEFAEAINAMGSTFDAFHAACQQGITPDLLRMVIGGLRHSADLIENFAAKLEAMAP